MKLYLTSAVCRPKAVIAYRILTFVMVLSLVVPGIAAARHTPPEADHVSAYPFMPQECGGPPPAAVPANWTLAVCDTFDDNANGWLVGPNEDAFVRGTQEVVGGSYNWQMEALQDVISAAWLPDRTFGDLYVAVDAGWGQPPPGVDQYGLMFRHFNPDNYYLFTVAATLRQYSLQVVNRDQWEILIDWTEDPAIRASGTNRLAVLAQGSSMTVFVNGQQLARYNDARISEGKVGVTATYNKGERINLRFDNLEVRAPSGEGVVSPTPRSSRAPTPTTAPLPQPTAIGACQHGRWLVLHGWQRVLCDEFADNANDWVVGEYTDQYARVKRAIENKMYTWETDTVSGAASWVQLNDKTFTDFWVSTSAKMVSAPDSGYYGLIFRKVDNDNYYRFGVSETGHYRLDIYYQGQWGNLIAWSDSDAIRPGRVNDIAALAEGPRLSFYINDEKVADAYDARLAQGLVGLAAETFAGERASVQFMDFEVVVPSGEQSTPPSPMVTLEPQECDIPATAPAGWQTALCDLFLDNRNSWPVGPQTLPGGTVTRDIAAATYGLNVQATQDVHYWVGHEGQTFTDFYAATSASIYSGRPETSYELVFRAADQNNFYTLAAAGNYFQVAARIQGAWRELIPWTFSDALRPKEFNQLAVLAQGPNLTFYINDMEVGSLTNELIPAGQVGLGATVYAGDTASIQFHSMLVLVPPELATPVAPPGPTLPPPPPRRVTPELPTAAPTEPLPPPSPTAPSELLPTAAAGPDACGPVAVPEVRSWPSGLCETFDSNVLGWGEGQTEDQLGVIWRTLEDGVYRWQVQAKGSPIYSGRYDNMPSLKDFYAAVDARRSSGAEDAEYGLQFRRTAEGNYGVFIVTDSGIFLADLFYNGDWETLVPPTSSTAIASGQFNRLAVKAIGPRLSFYINGQQVAEAEEPRLVEGQVGVSVGLREGQQAVFKFDNFEIRPAPTGAVPLPTLPAPPPTAAVGPTLPPPTQALPAPTQPVPPSGTLYQNPSWGVSLVYPSGWITSEESSEEYFSIGCGPSEGSLEVFEGTLDPSLKIVAPVLGVVGGYLQPVIEVPEPDATGRAPTGEVLKRFIEQLEQGFVEAGAALTTVGDMRPVQAGGAQGSQIELQFPNDIGRMYIAAFTLPNEIGAFLVVMTPEDQQATARQLFDSALASFRMSGPPSATPSPVFQPTRAGFVTPPPTSQTTTTTDQKWECLVCGYVYDPAVGDDTQGILPGTPFEDLPDDWVCPDCGLNKEMFEPVP